jgi:AcrR family transcriptional regulator
VQERVEPLAAASTSSRMLIYHVGTRDALLRAVLVHARRRQRATLGDLLRARPHERYDDTLRRVWAAMTGPEVRPYFRMFGPLPPKQERLLWPGFREEATTEWLAPLEEGLRTLGRPGTATVVLATVRGLLIDLDATGDHERTDRALEELLAPVGGSAGPAP